LLAWILGNVGRSEEALQMVEQAMRRHPLMLDGHLIFIGEAYALTGKLEEAIDPLQRYLTRYPNFLGVHLSEHTKIIARKISTKSALNRRQL